MEERGNKTIMCSVLFLDIVGYSKKSVVGQISLKDRFNGYLSMAIRDVPMTDRIILDTGDGAAINFLGDVEDALKAALSLREGLLSEGSNMDHHLLVRMGINLGPVRLVRDINGQPNIVGDGINVAQRVMGFADADQILVSRSYYDAVSRLSPQYAGMFHYQGSRTDKHVREHEVYAIGYPGDRTTRQEAIAPAAAKKQPGNIFAATMGRVHALWRMCAARLDALIELVINRFRQAEPRQRVLYVLVAAVPLLLIIMLLTKLARHEAPAMPAQMAVQTAKISPPTPVAAPMALAPAADGKAKAPASSSVEKKPKARKNAAIKNPKEKSGDTLKTNPRDKIASESKAEPAEDQTGKTSKDDAATNATVTSSGGGKNAYIKVSCVEGTEIFVDGVRKGRIESLPLTVAVPPGKHTVIVSHSVRGIYTQSVELGSGKTVHIRPSLCD